MRPVRRVPDVGQSRSNSENLPTRTRSLPLEAASCEVACRRTDPAGKDESDGRRGTRDDRQLRLELSADVGGLAQGSAELDERRRELFAFRALIPYGPALRCVPSAFDRRRGQPRLTDRLLGHRRRAPLDRADREQAEQAGQQEQPAL